MALSKVCPVDGCGKPQHAKGLCSAHASRLKRYGDPLGGGPAKQKNKGTPCQVADCNQAAAVKGMCHLHYGRYLKHGDPLVCKNPVGVRPEICSLPECGLAHHAHGFCARHAFRFRKYGDPLAGGPMQPTKMQVQEALNEAVAHKGDECFFWPFGKPDYPTVVWEGETLGAHRLVCRLAHGEPPAARMVAAHSCGNGHLGCTSAQHLRWATFQENEDDKRLHGTKLQGAKCPNAKLTDKDVHGIRAMKGLATQTEIGALFGISQSVVSKIHLRQAWAWLD